MDAIHIPMPSPHNPGSLQLQSGSPLLWLPIYPAAHPSWDLLRYLPLFLPVTCLPFAHPNSVHFSTETSPTASVCTDNPSAKPAWHPHFTSTWHLIISGPGLNNTLPARLSSQTENTFIQWNLRARKSLTGKARLYQLGLPPLSTQPPQASISISVKEE